MPPLFHREFLFLLLWFLPIMPLKAEQELSYDSTPYPRMNAKGSTLQQFIPSGWQVISQTTGDLNDDDWKDIAVILQGPEKVMEYLGCTEKGKLLSGMFAFDHEAPDEQPFGDIEMNIASPRILLVLFGNKEGGFERALQDNRIVLRSNEGGMFDPVSAESLTIKRNSLFISYYGGSAWRWALSAQFRLEPMGWRLIGFTRESFHTHSKQKSKYDYNLLTGDLHIFSQDESGRKSACVACIRGERCSKQKDCPSGYILPNKKEIWKKGVQRQPLLVSGFRCALSDDSIIPKATPSERFKAELKVTKGAKIPDRLLQVAGEMLDIYQDKKLIHLENFELRFAGKFTDVPGQKPRSCNENQHFYDTARGMGLLFSYFYVSRLKVMGVKETDTYYPAVDKIYGRKPLSLNDLVEAVGQRSLLATMPSLLDFFRLDDMFYLHAALSEMRQYHDRFQRAVNKEAIDVLNGKEYLSEGDFYALGFAEHDNQCFTQSVRLQGIQLNGGRTYIDTHPDLYFYSFWLRRYNEGNIDQIKTVLDVVLSLLH